MDRLTQSVLYYPCESCMDALMGNSIFAWLFLDRPNNIWGEEKSVVLIPGVCGSGLLVCRWLKWMGLFFRLDGNRNKHKTSNCHDIFEPAGWLWIFVSMNDLYLKTLKSQRKVTPFWCLPQPWSVSLSTIRAFTAFIWYCRHSRQSRLNLPWRYLLGVANQHQESVDE